MALFKPIAHNKTMEIQKWNKKDSIFDGSLDTAYLAMDYCDVFYIENKGFCVLNKRPKYPLYDRLGIPEIQDVFVIPQHRGQGLATALIHHCETVCDGDMIGISVPVNSKFAVAQRLYVGLGYLPDGNGVTYDREPVQPDTMVCADEYLCLMFIKDLKTDEGQPHTVT